MKEYEVTEPKVIGIKGLSAWYGISEPTARQLIEDDIVPNIKLGAKTALVPVIALESFERELGIISARRAKLKEDDS